MWGAAKRKTVDAAMTDAELVRAFQNGGDRDGAFMVLFERYGPVTHAFLRRRIGNAAVAAELNQDLYLGVLEGLDSFRGDSSFKTWLFRMAQNRLLNLRRRWRTHVDELPGEAPEDLVERVADAGCAAGGARIDRTRTVRFLAECMAALPEVERAVVVGQYFDGVTLEELTRRFKMTNKSGARASLIAGQRKLRRCLEQSGIDAATALDGRSE